MKCFSIVDVPQWYAQKIPVLILWWSSCLSVCVRAYFDSVWCSTCMSTHIVPHPSKSTYLFYLSIQLTNPPWLPRNRKSKIQCWFQLLWLVNLEGFPSIIQILDYPLFQIRKPTAIHSILFKESCSPFPLFHDHKLYYLTHYPIPVSRSMLHRINQ